MMIRTSVRVGLLATLALLLASASNVQAQQGLAYPPLVAGQPLPQGQPMMQGQMMQAQQAMYGQPQYGQGMPQQAPPYSMAGGYMNAYGEDVVNPASYCADQCGPGGCGPMGYGGGECYCGGGGCYGGQCGGQCDGGGLLSKCGLISGLLCNPGYGPNTEQCGPHYFDFSAEFLRYQRAKSPIGDSTIISSFGFANDDLANLDNQKALTGGDIGGEDSNGYRLTGRLDVGALSVFELSYSGLYNEGGGATVFQQGTNSNQTLFSLFSRFGTQTNGLLGVPGSAGPPTGENFEETDNAEQHSVTYESELHTAEASFRRYWVGYSPRISGTLLFGFRYTHLNNEFGFFSDSGINNAPNGGTININFETDNRLAGFQTGGDVWMTVMQGLRVGGDMRVGIYNNDYQTGGSVSASDGSPTSVSEGNGNHVAFLTEARLSAVMNISSTLSAKVGYEVLYISDLVLAGDNLDTAMPYGEVNGLTTSPISTNGEAFYHGWHAGLEYIY